MRQMTARPERDPHYTLGRILVACCFVVLAIQAFIPAFLLWVWR